jgi:hypothetical protein
MYEASGKPAGGCFVRYASGHAAARVMAKYDKAVIGDRWLDIYLATSAEMAGGRGAAQLAGSMVLSMRGLPFSCASASVAALLASHGIATRPGSVLCGTDPDGRPSGTAVARAAAEVDAPRAVSLSRQLTMHGRYIEVFRTTEQEYERAGSAASQLTQAGDAWPEGAGGGGAAALQPEEATLPLVSLRGLPFAASAEAVLEGMLGGLRVAPAGLHMVLEADGRPHGVRAALGGGRRIADRPERALDTAPSGHPRERQPRARQQDLTLRV